VFAKFGLGILIIFGALIFGVFDSYSTGVFVVVLVILLLDTVVDLLILTGLRNQLRSFIQSHGVEIQTAS
jgi:hypothetical protein